MAKSGAQRSREYRARKRAEREAQKVVEAGGLDPRIARDWATELPNLHLTIEALVGMVGIRLLLLAADPDSSPRDLLLLADWLRTHYAQGTTAQNPLDALKEYLNAEAQDESRRGEELLVGDGR